MTIRHSGSCPRALAWDMGDQVACACPRGWPRKSVRNPYLFYPGDAVRMSGTVIGSGPVTYLIELPSGQQITARRGDLTLRRPALKALSPQSKEGGGKS